MTVIEGILEGILDSVTYGAFEVLIRSPGRLILFCVRGGRGGASKRAELVTGVLAWGLFVFVFFQFFWG
jgi:hypothetical protein